MKARALKMKINTATSPNGKYGLWHTRDKYWIGNDKGPLRYDDFDLARAAAQIFAERQQLGSWSVRAKEIDDAPKVDTGTVTPPLSGEEAVRRIESRAKP